MKLTSSLIKIGTIFLVGFMVTALIVYRDQIMQGFSSEKNSQVISRDGTSLAETDTNTLQTDTIGPPIPTQSVDVRQNPIKTDQYDPESK